MYMRTRSVLVGALAAGLGLACAVASAAEAGSLADALRIIQSKQYRGSDTQFQSHLPRLARVRPGDDVRRCRSQDASSVHDR
jgi:hypothetical protein